MVNEKRKLGEIPFEAHAVCERTEGLTKVGRARRDVLGYLGKWGATATVLGLGAETTMNSWFGRSVLQTAEAAGTVSAGVPGSSGNLPRIPADQNPPPALEPTGTIYWVATDGSDSNPGTEASPLATVQKAYSVCGNNDGIYIKAGLYFGNFTWTKPNIIMRGAPGTTREQVKIQYAEGGSGGGGRTIGFFTGTQNVQVYGITIQAGPEPPAWVQIKNAPSGSDSDNWKLDNWRQEAVTVIGAVQNLKFINCVFRYFYYRGIFTRNDPNNSEDWPDNMEVAYCNFYGGGWHTAGADIGLGRRAGYYHIHHNELHSGSDGVVCHGARIGSLVEYNHVYDQYREDGLDWKHTPDTNPNLPSGHRTVLRYNIIHNCGYQAVTVQRNTRRIDVYANLIYGNGVTGGVSSSIWINALRISTDGPYQTQDVRIWNNDIFNSTGSGLSVNLGVDSHYPRDIIVENNRIYDNARYGIHITRGRNISVRDNILSNNAGGNGTNGAQYLNNVPSETDSDKNTVYLPSGAFRWGESGGSALVLSQWQSLFRKDLNSTELPGRFIPFTPPAAPTQMKVTDAGGFRGAERFIENVSRRRMLGLLS